MKKLLLLTTIMSVSSVAYAGNFYVKGGLEFAPIYTEVSYDGLKLNEEKGKNLGYEIAFEYTQNITPKLELGIGIAAQIHSETEKMEDRYDINANNYANYSSDIAGFDSIPVYLIAKYNFNQTQSGVKPYVKFDLGYSFNDGEGYYTYTEREGTILNLENASLSYDNGAYVAFGGGIEYNNFTFDLMYKYNASKISIEGEGEYRIGTSTSRYRISDSTDFDYGRIVASIGYKF